MPEEFLTRKDMMKLLKISHQTLHNLMNEGLPYIKLGKKTLFRRIDVDRFLESRMVKPRIPNRPKT